MGPAREWAAASARTLARRLRRSRARTQGLTRAKALQLRSAQFRVSVAEHWSLCDTLGAFFPKYSDAIAAARLLRVAPDVCGWHAEALSVGNWARHAPPPGSATASAVPPGVRASELEHFRSSLFEREIGGCAHEVGGEDTLLGGSDFDFVESPPSFGDDLPCSSLPRTPSFGSCPELACAPDTGSTRRLRASDDQRSPFSAHEGPSDGTDEGDTDARASAEIPSASEDGGSGLSSGQRPPLRRSRRATSEDSSVGSSGVSGSSTSHSSSSSVHEYDAEEKHRWAALFDDNEFLQGGWTSGARNPDVDDPRGGCSGYRQLRD